MNPANLRCEYRHDPLGIDTRRPRLSWQLTSPERGARQTAYRVLVASSRERLRADQADMWDSAKVRSDRSIHVAYDGESLQSGKRYWWKVRVWDQDGRASAWSKPAMWQMGLLGPEDWQAKWIGASGLPDSLQHAAVMLRKAFQAGKKLKRATAYVSGLGYYELYLNGKKVGDRVLDPGFTDYTERVLYATYDVTEALRSGRNAIGVLLGGGWYYSAVPDLFGFQNAPWRAPPKLLLQMELEYEDGTTQTLVSDRTWRWAVGPITFNGMRGGETYDARREKPGWKKVRYDGSGWKQIEVVSAPEGRLAAQQHPPIRVAETVEPTQLTEPKPGLYVFDFGKNLTGWVRFEVSGRRGQAVALHFNEVLIGNGTVDTTYSASHTHGRFQKGVFILDGEGTDVYEPRFTYHGFRYVQVTGLSERPSLEDMQARSVHTDLESAGRFASSNERLNQLQSAVRRTLLSSVHGMPGEEPTREKMGWTFDAFKTMKAYVYNFEAARIYRKYLDDLIDAQDENGHAPPIVPTPGWGRSKEDGSPGTFSDPWWGATLAYVANKLYAFYGDRRVLERAYAPAKAYVDYLGTTAEEHRLDWFLGDWLDRYHHEREPRAKPALTPVELTSTAAYYYLAETLSRNAALLGKEGDARRYDELAGEIKQAFNTRFLNRETGLYVDSSQTAQALPLSLGLVPDAQKALALERLLEDIKENNEHLTTGFVGTMPMLRYLSGHGHADVAYAMVTQEEGSGWLYMVEDGSSTLGENLHPQGYGTYHHPFGASVGSWFYRSLAGIRPDLEGPGFKKIIIEPRIVEGLRRAHARYHSVRGRIESTWRRRGEQLRLEVTVPANTTATVRVPARSPGTVREGDRRAGKAGGVTFLRMEDDHAVYHIGSGNYVFRSVLR